MSNIIALHTQNTIPAVSTTAPVVAREEERQFFEVEKKALASEYGIIKNKQGIFVGDTCINVVSNNYQVHQPAEIYQTFKSVAEQSGLEIVRVLDNKHNGGLLMSARYNNCKIVGEEHGVNLTFYTSHCGRYKTFLTLDLLRMACFNQVPALVKNKRFIFAEKHYKNALDISTLQRQIELIPGAVEIYNNKANLLIDSNMSFPRFKDFYIEHYKMDTEAKQFDSKIAKLKSVYYNATGQRELSENAYKAFQAITFMNTHETKNTQFKLENIITTGSKDSLEVLEGLLIAA